MASSPHARRLRVAVLASHPIQYQSPLLRALAGECRLQVYYAHRQTADQQGDAGYGIAFDWDSDLLSGYESQFLHNASRRPNVYEFDGCSCPEIDGIVARGRFDVFVVTGWYLHAHWQAVAACRKYRVPVVVRGDSQLATPRSPWKRLAKELGTRIAVGQFDGFLTVGQRNREYLEHYGAPPDRIFHVPHFVDQDFFRERAPSSNAARKAARERLGIRADACVVLFVGRFVAFKRPLDIIDAAARLRGRVEPLEVVFVGAGELEPALRLRARELNVSVRLLGFRNQSELPIVYGAADMLVLPSDGNETWGLVVNEAFSCGLPAVVSASVGSAPDLIVENETGLTYPCGDIARLATAIAAAADLRDREQTRVRLDAINARYSCRAAAAGTLEAVSSLARRETM